MEEFKKIELTILIPCLNERSTLKQCIKDAKEIIKKIKVNGEILIADNGSTDGSLDIVEEENVRYIKVLKKGYGSTLIEGTAKSFGKYIIMGDADGSYDFLEVDKFLVKLKNGYDFVIGNRLNTNIEKRAMPFLNRYFGTPAITKIGNLLYKTNLKDYNCGLRGYNREKIMKLNLVCQGMEYASEMIIKSKKSNLKMCQIDIAFRKDKRDGKPHLRKFRDFIRHLVVLIKCKKEKKYER